MGAGIRSPYRCDGGCPPVMVVGRRAGCSRCRRPSGARLDAAPTGNSVAVEAALERCARFEAGGAPGNGGVGRAALQRGDVCCRLGEETPKLTRIKCMSCPCSR